MAELPGDDLDRVVAAGAGLWERLEGARLLLTGATGFFGRWLLGTLALARERHRLDVQAIVTTRDAGRAAARLGRVAAADWLQLVEGDIRSFRPPGPLTHVVHGAADADARLNRERPALVLETAVEGARRVLAAAAAGGASRLLLLGSGAVYGPQPPGVTHLPEEAPSALDPLDPGSAYGEGKRLAELLGVLAEPPLEVVAARCFTFLGPGLPLDGSYAAGNFVRDALAGGPIRVSGDGTARRSYLYASDLALWAWTLLLRGRAGRAYNVGSEHDVSVGDLAARVAAAAGPSLTVEIARRPAADALPERYVPSTRRAREELGLTETVGLDEAIRRTLDWHRER